MCSQNGAEKREKNGMNTFEQSEEEDEGKERENKIPNRKKTGKQWKWGVKNYGHFWWCTVRGWMARCVYTAPLTCTHKCVAHLFIRTHL